MKLIRVNMTSQDIYIEDVPLAYSRLGGRGLTSSYLNDHVNPLCDALGGDNKLIIAPGLLTGTSAPSSGRTSVGAKSPLTGTIKESNVGGSAGQYLAAHGIKAVVLEGAALEKGAWVLVIEDYGIKLESNPNLSGLGNYETVNYLKQEYGPDCSVICVGPVGEAGAALATVAVTDMEGRPARHAGRGGMGAVMGSKGIKAIVISRPARLVVEAKNPVKFKEICAGFAKSVVQAKKSLAKYGTALLVNVINGYGGLPTRNYTTGQNEFANNISGEKLSELCKLRGGVTGHACSRGCVVRCSNVYKDSGGNYVTSGLEYETIALLGSNCGLNDLDSIAELDRICDNLGIDTIEVGAALGVAMEAGEIPFGDFVSMQKALAGIVSGSYLGKILGQGTAVAGKVLGVKRTPTVKGQAMAAYDPRAVKGTGVTYATSTMGADHTAGNCLPGLGGLDPGKPEGQITLSKKQQETAMICDILGICIFVGSIPENVPVFASIVSAFTDQETGPEILLEQARRVLKAELEFNRAAGIAKSQNDLPDFFRTEPLPNNGLVFDIPKEELEEF
ncbi:MAG: aldehyde ferredoxin oxidoreductase C-terminal domain-containing protein [Thermincola sp.]|nr:aldehyde ferredoxin oxidoreductase C-terminal domain-containing protein [Thermincola sp.]MDT3702814.1 aldehyde ferredoxin oxidoreductase C-terminal domain-containing protein [Thermincola sp.]